MGVLDSFFSVPNPIKIQHLTEENPKPSIYGAQILSYLRPVIKICRIFGIFPFELELKSNYLSLKHNRKGWLTYSAVIWLITTCYMTFHAISLVICIGQGQAILYVAAQSMWINCALIAYVVSIFMFLRGHKLVELFDDWCLIEKDLERLFCPIITNLHIWRFQKLYFLLALLSNSFCAYHVIKQPTRPIYPFYYLKETDYNKIHHFVYSIFQMLISSWAWTGYIIVEGTCCFFATVFIQSMKTLIAGLDSTLTNNTSKNTEEGEFIKRPIHMDHTKLSVSMILNNMENMNHEIVQSPFKNIIEISNINKEVYLLFAIRKLQKIASLQFKINAIIGPLLLLDVGQLVLLSCSLTFLPVRFAFELDVDSTLTFVANGITVFTRLILLIVCLGNVFSTGQDVNAAFAKAMTSSTLSTACQNPILAHLSVYSANPVCFTAWGFFPISRGTLLAAFSLISTYAIVFFQLKN